MSPIADVDIFLASYMGVHLRRFVVLAIEVYYIANDINLLPRVIWRDLTAVNTQD